MRGIYGGIEMYQIRALSNKGLEALAKIKRDPYGDREKEHADIRFFDDKMEIMFLKEQHLHSDLRIQAGIKRDLAKRMEKDYRVYLGKDFEITVI
jgi:hypothetical protein